MTVAGRAHRVVERPPAAGDDAVVSCRPRGALARTSRSALADFVSSSSPQPIRPRSQARTPCPPRRPSPPRPPSRGLATWPRPSPFAGLRFAPPRASPRPPPAAPPFASTPRVRHRHPPSISPARAAPRVPVPRADPSPPWYLSPPPASSRMTWQTWPVEVPRSFAAATATRARDAPTHVHTSALPRPRGRHPSARAVPRPIPASSSRPTPRAGRVVIPSAHGEARRRAMYFPPPPPRARVPRSLTLPIPPPDSNSVREEPRGDA